MTTLQRPTEIEFSGEVTGTIGTLEVNKLLTFYYLGMEFNYEGFLPDSILDEVEELVKTKTGKTIWKLLEEEVG